MAHSKFVYVTYIRTTPQTLWDALTKPEFIRQYWWPAGTTLESEWKVGSSWKMVFADGRVADAGEILESDPPRRLVIKWRNEIMPEFKAEGFVRGVYELEQDGDCVRLTISHTMEIDNAKLIEGVSHGWPIVLSSLKSFLETGAPMLDIHLPASVVRRVT
jgi:uncharacterized protein YndB with AHSA1/START domain